MPGLRLVSLSIQKLQQCLLNVFVTKWSENIRTLEHGALEGMKTAALLKKVSFIVNVFGWGFILVCFMSCHYRCRDFLAQSLQLVKTGQGSLSCS